MSTRFSRMSPEAREHHLAKMRNPKLHHNRVCRNAYGIIEAPRVRVPVCQTCYNITDRRPLHGLCVCGKSWQAEEMPRAVARIGSAAEMCAEARDC